VTDAAQACSAQDPCHRWMGTRGNVKGMPMWRITIGAIAATALCASTATAQPRPSHAEQALGQLGAMSVRKVSSDIALPADSTEYEALGKNAVLMLTAQSALASELPLRSAYVVIGDVRVPLQRVTVLQPEASTQSSSGRSEAYSRQSAFYLLPIYLLARDAYLRVDFGGRREGFGVTRFSAATLNDAPTFVRADDYAYPSEPDQTAVRALIAREFPKVRGQDSTPD
jgi:hypothetical protein